MNCCIKSYNQIVQVERAKSFVRELRFQIIQYLLPPQGSGPRGTNPEEAYIEVPARICMCCYTTIHINEAISLALVNFIGSCAFAFRV